MDERNRGSFRSIFGGWEWRFVPPAPVRRGKLMGIVGRLTEEKVFALRVGDCIAVLI